MNMGRNMKVTCKKCFRNMRSDHLKRYMKQHEESKQVSFCEVSPSSSETSLNTNFNSESTCNSYESSSMERGKIIEKLMTDNEEYKYKLERGKILYEEVNQLGIQEESLCQEYKVLLNIYRKQKKNIDIERTLEGNVTRKKIV